jgi:hypothetical protein
MSALYLPHEITRRFYRRSSSRAPREAELAKLKAAGVNLVHVGLPDPMLVAQVVYWEDGSFLFSDEFNRAEEVAPAFTILCQGDDGEAIDIAAWSPSSNRLATWAGRAWAIDQWRLLQPRINDADALPMFEDP